MMQDEKQAIANLMPRMKKHGVDFISMTPLLACPKYSAKAYEILKQEALKYNPTVIAGIDSRGYIIGSILADSLGIKFVMIAKSGKLPGEVIHSEGYKTEYNSQDSLEIAVGVIDKKDRVWVIDDILATGGSALNASNLIILSGAQLVGFLFLAEILSLHGKETILKKFPFVHVFSVCEFSSETLSTSELPPLNIVATEKKMDHIIDISEDTSQIAISDLDLDVELHRIILMYHPSRRQHAEEIFLRFPNYFQLQDISWKHFPDGWYDIKLLKPQNLVNRHVVFLFAMDDTSIIMEQMFVCMILPAQFLKSFIIDINYFAPGTHERVTEPGVCASAEPMARMFSNIPHTKTGPVIIQLTDLHALPNQFYFQKCFTSFISSIPMLLGCKPQSTIVFPDDGAYKRFSPMILAKNPCCPMLICSKMRDGENRSVTISEYKNFPRHYLQCGELLKEVIIVDDLCHSGSTLVECAKALKKIDLIQSIDVWVTHAVFENHNYESFLKTGKHATLFRDIHITNSILSTSEKVDFKVHSMAQTIGANVLHLIQPPKMKPFLICFCDYSITIRDIFSDSYSWSLLFIEDLAYCSHKLPDNRLEIIILSVAQGWSITIQWFMHGQEFKLRREVVPRNEEVKDKLIEMIFH